MKFFTQMALAGSLFIASAFAMVSDANAVVCARGVYRAGCAGPHGGVAVHGYHHRGVAVHRRYVR